MCQLAVFCVDAFSDHRTQGLDTRQMLNISPVSLLHLDHKSSTLLIVVVSQIPLHGCNKLGMLVVIGLHLGARVDHGFCVDYATHHSLVFIVNGRLSLLLEEVIETSMVGIINRTPH